MMAVVNFFPKLHVQVAVIAQQVKPKWDGISYRTHGATRLISPPIESRQSGLITVMAGHSIRARVISRRMRGALGGVVA